MYSTSVKKHQGLFKSQPIDTFHDAGTKAGTTGTVFRYVSRPVNGDSHIMRGIGAKFGGKASTCVEFRRRSPMNGAAMRPRLSQSAATQASRATRDWKEPGVSDMA